jgi:LuxR family transcriptional regulator
MKIIDLQQGAGFPGLAQPGGYKLMPPINRQRRMAADQHAGIGVLMLAGVVGVTVPVHMPQGDYATVTGVRNGAQRDFSEEAMRVLADFSLLAQVFHEAAYELFDNTVLNASGIRLTERERECLAYSSNGLSAKEISRVIDRSVPTVVMHLNAAARKLGARNRTQAVVRATQCRLLDPVPPYKL